MQYFSGLIADTSVPVSVGEDMQCPERGTERVAQLWIIQIWAVQPITAPILSGQQRFKLRISLDEYTNQLDRARGRRRRPLESGRQEALRERSRSPRRGRGRGHPWSKDEVQRAEEHVSGGGGLGDTYI